MGSNDTQRLTLAEINEVLKEEGLGGFGALGHQSYTGITSDSRSMKDEMIFVALRGERVDGNQFLPKLYQQFPRSLFITETANPSFQERSIVVLDARKALALLAKKFFGDPSQDMRVVGVTGTSGKTTTTFLIEAILRSAGFKVGLLGTVVNRWPGHETSSNLTTADPIEFYRNLKTMKDSGVTSVVLEVSSHALKQHRLFGLGFDVCVFTNLSRDHLDYHPDMEDYYFSKRMLFSEYPWFQIRKGRKWLGLVCSDDEYGRRLLSELKQISRNSCDVQAYGLNASAEITATEIRLGYEGIQAKVDGFLIESQLLGNFNLQNILAAWGVARKLGVDPSRIVKALKEIPGVPGRLETVTASSTNSNQVHCFVDYAHKPEALKNVLKLLSDLRDQSKTKGRILCVFGCGGDRDRGKRPLMGQIAEEWADEIWLTSDNPRSEDPAQIIQEIRNGFKDPSRAHDEVDREKAIRAAIKNAEKGDCVLIAGKGHETYQILGNQRRDFDDRVVAKSALDSKKT